MGSTARPSFIFNCSKRIFNHLPRKLCYDNAVWYLEIGRCPRGTWFTNGINYSAWIEQLLNRDYQVELVQLVDENQLPTWCNLISSSKSNFPLFVLFPKNPYEKKPLCVWKKWEHIKIYLHHIDIYFSPTDRGLHVYKEKSKSYS